MDMYGGVNKRKEALFYDKPHEIRPGTGKDIKKLEW